MTEPEKCSLHTNGVEFHYFQCPPLLVIGLKVCGAGWVEWWCVNLYSVQLSSSWRTIKFDIICCLFNISSLIICADGIDEDILLCTDVTIKWDVIPNIVFHIVWTAEYKILKCLSFLILAKLEHSFWGHYLRFCLGHNSTGIFNHYLKCLTFSFLVWYIYLI